jgi:hypothetical protein
MIVWSVNWQASVGMPWELTSFQKLLPLLLLVLVLTYLFQLCLVQQKVNTCTCFFNWFRVSHFQQHQHFIAKTRAKDVVHKWILPSNKWVCLAQTHPSNKWVDPKVPHVHPLAWGSKNLTWSLHIKYYPKVGAFPKKKHPRCGLVIFKTT